MVSFAGTDGWMLNQRGVEAFDVDGDGMADLLRLEAGNHQYLQGRGNYFGAPRPLTGASDVDLESSALIDLDGDARPELVRIVDDTWRVYKLSDATWESLGEWPGTQGIPLHAPDAVLTDLNGDGRIDVVRPRGSGISVNFGGASGLGPTSSLPALSAADVGVQPGRPDVRFVDVNGDGLADVVWLTDAWMKIFLGRGDGTFVPFGRTPYPWGGNAAVDLSHILLADLNRDGLVDLVRVDAANVTWFRGETDGRFGVFFRHLARPESADADAVVTIADLNGNGSQDVVWSSPRGLWALDLAGATSAGMLTPDRQRSRHAHDVHLRRVRGAGGRGRAERRTLAGASAGLDPGAGDRRDRSRRGRPAPHRPARRPGRVLGRRRAPLRWLPDRSRHPRGRESDNVEIERPAFSPGSATTACCAASPGTCRRRSAPDSRSRPWSSRPLVVVRDPGSGPS